MKTFRLAWAEIARHHRPLHRVALAFMLIVPTLYGALYLWSNWDPYGKLDQIPVAVVNEDQPVQVDGRTVDAGSMVVQNLKDDPIFGWVFTDAEDAAAGLEDGDYYLTITVPEDFSARLASGADTTPQRAEIQVRRNDANGYVIGVMAETVQARLHEQINAAATEAYFESVYGSLAAIRDAVQQADTGAGQLRDGLASADTGAATLASGLADAQTGASQLATGATQVADGAVQVADGTQQIADVVNPIADEIVPAIPGVASAATDLATAASDLTGTVSTDADSLISRVDSANQALDDLVAAHPELASDPAFQTVSSAFEDVDTRVNEVDSAVSALHTDAQALQADAQDLENAVPDLQTTVRDAQDQVNELNDGAHDVADGAGQVRDGANDLSTALVDAKDGAAELSTGITSAHTGATDLATGLDQLVAAVPALDPEQRQANAAILGNPTDVTLTVDNPAELYGRGLAPFFFSISLWVFGIVIFLILRPTSGRALVSRASSWRVALVGWLPILGIGLVGAWLLLAVADLALGLNPVHPVQSFALVSLAVAVFTLIAHLARSALGLVGSAVLLVLLMIQLAASAGIYPAETLPPALLAIHPYLPMTYLIEGLRVTFTGGSAETLTRAVIILLVVGAATFAGTWAVTARRRTWTMADVHPPLED